MDINIGQQTECAGYKPQIAIGLDKTLTKQGYAADAKAVGLAIQGLSGDYVPIQSDEAITVTSGDSISLRTDGCFVQVEQEFLDVSYVGNNGLSLSPSITSLYTEYSGITLGATYSNPHITITAGDDYEQLQGNITLKAGGQGNIYLDGVVYNKNASEATLNDIVTTRGWVSEQGYVLQDNTGGNTTIAADNVALQSGQNLKITLDSTVPYIQVDSGIQFNVNSEDVLFSITSLHINGTEVDLEKFLQDYAKTNP